MPIRYLKKRKHLENLAWYRGLTVIKYPVLAVGIGFGALLFFVGLPGEIGLSLVGLACIAAALVGWVCIENAVIYIVLGAGSLERDSSKPLAATGFLSKLKSVITLEKLIYIVSFVVSFLIVKSLAKSSSEFGSILGFCFVTYLLSALYLKILKVTLPARWVKLALIAPLAAYLTYIFVYSLSSNTVVPFSIAGSIVWALISYLQIRSVLKEAAFKKYNLLSSLAPAGTALLFIMVAPAMAQKSALVGMTEACEKQMRGWASDVGSSDRELLCSCTFDLALVDAKCDSVANVISGSSGNCISTHVKRVSESQGGEAINGIRDRCLADKTSSDLSEKFYAGYRNVIEKSMADSFITELAKRDTIRPWHKQFADCLSNFVMSECEDKTFVGYVRCSNDEDDKLLNRAVASCKSK